MTARARVSLIAVVLACVAVAPAAVRAEEPGRNVAEMKLAPVPGLPTCAPGAVASGDPAKGPSIIFAKMAAGCVIPWHWHTANEHLMIVSGVARLDMRDGEPITLRAGGFGLMPSRHVHRARCTTACMLYVYSDTAFDIHYVDAKGDEIPASEAVAAVHEKTATTR